VNQLLCIIEAVINLNAPTTTPTANANKPIAAPTGVAKKG
jgi:hypothetical protein